jgi:hypothetical protein
MASHVSIATRISRKPLQFYSECSDSNVNVDSEPPFFEYNKRAMYLLLSILVNHIYSSYARVYVRLTFARSLLLNSELASINIHA